MSRTRKSRPYLDFLARHGAVGGVAGRMAGRMAAVSLALAYSPAALAVDGHCKIGKVAEFPITLRGLRPLMTAGINGADVKFVVDSGAVFSMISPASASELKLETRFAPAGLSIQGAGGGRATVSIARVKTFMLAGVPLKNIEFLVGGSEMGGGSVGLLGQNVLHTGDVEYDLGNGVVRLMKPTDCRNSVLAYWAGASTPYSSIPIQAGAGAISQTLGTAEVNGISVRVMFDTGAGRSFLSLPAATRAGIKPDSPGVVYAGASYGIGKTTFPTYIAPVASFKLGEEEIKHTQLRIGGIDLPTADMLLGLDFFLSHRVYVANGQHKLYFTYNGGPVFDLSIKHPTEPASEPGPGPGPTTAPEREPASVPASASTPPGAEAAPPVPPPQQAAELSRRGTAAAARGDLANAIKELSQACKLAPDVPEYRYQRGLAYQQNRQPELALEDFDHALALRAGDVSTLLSRAGLLVQRGDRTRAVADLDSADAAASRESDLRLWMARLYLATDRLDAALGQYDLWIEVHPADARYPAALNGRCWVRALQGTDLPMALKDCNAAKRRAPKSDPILFAKILDSRGLVYLRMGDYDRSVADYNASLKLNPKNPWGWYGLGLDELRQHKAAAGEAAVARGEAFWPKVADEFTRRGITP